MATAEQKLASLAALSPAARTAARARWLTPLAFLAADTTAIAAGAAASVLLWFHTGHPLNPAFYLALWPLIGLFIAAYASTGLYTAIALHPAEELRRVTIATSLVCVSLGAMTFLFKEGILYSRAVFLLTWMLALVLVPLDRALARWLFGRSAWWGEPVFVVGDGPAAARLLDQIRRKPSLGLRPVDSPRAARCALIVAADLPPNERARLLFDCQRQYARIILVPEVTGLPSLWVAGTDLNGILGLQMSQRLLEPWAVWVKNVSDFVMAAAISAAALPFIALIAAAVKLTSPGPAFFGHRRRGREGAVFRAWKFRTMVLNADQVLEDHLHADPAARREWARTQKLARDPRVTPLGRFLRRSSLDELPQLWNVLRREMSLVGPRPIVDNEIARYGDGYAVYQRVRPGMTGLWQVSGRNSVGYDERVKLDLYYVTNWSLWLDLYILARTFRAVAEGDGAY